MAKVQGVPVDDDGGEQVEAGDPVMLTLRRAVVDFALTADVQGIFQRMICLALVEADLCTALHADVEYPLDRKSTRLNSRHLCASRMPSSACIKYREPPIAYRRPQPKYSAP